jgi:long-chain acyl-CoA synthetase
MSKGANETKLFKNIQDYLYSTCKKYSTKTVFIEKQKYRTRIWTFNDLFEKTNQAVEYLDKKHLKKGDKIVICAPNSPYWACLFFACAVKGVIVVPLDMNSSSEFIKKAMSQTKPKFIFISKFMPQVPDIKSGEDYIEDFKSYLSSAPAAKPVRDIDIKPDDILLIAYSSGSTGDPKGVILTHKNICANMYSLQKCMVIYPTHRSVSIVPLSHLLELSCGLMALTSMGASVVYLPAVKPRAISEALQKDGVNIIVTVPAFLQLFKNSVMRALDQKGLTKVFQKSLTISKPLPKSVKRVVSHIVRTKIGKDLAEMYVGGARIDESLEQFWEGLGISVYQGYGLTEASPIVAVGSPKPKLNRSFTVGKPIPGVKVKLADDGEIMVSGPNVSSGYFRNPVATAETFKDGWLMTGDIGKFDKDGFLSIIGRKKSMIIGSSGMNVFPEDIERTLREYNDIKEAVVLGIENGTDTIITAVVMLNDNKTTAKDIIANTNEHLGSHQRIQAVVIWPEDDFPRTPTRKIIRGDVHKFASNNKSSSTNTQRTKGGNQLYQIIAKVTDKPVREISPKSTFVNDLGLDSIKRLELMAKIEDELGVVLSDTFVNQKSTVSDLEKQIKIAVVVTKKKGQPDWPDYRAAVYFRLLLQSIFFTLSRSFQVVEVEGNDLKGFDGPVIFIANHQSHLDAPDIIKALPRHVRTKTSVAAAKDYIFGNRATGFLSRIVFNTFPLDRHGNIDESLANIGKILDKGNSVLIFPEGTRTRTGEMQDFKKGIGVIAPEMGVPIIPIKISGNYEILPRKHHIPKRGKTTITIGQPLKFDDDSSYISVTEKLEEAIKKL